MRLLVILLAWVLRRQLDARGRMDPEQWQRQLLQHAPSDNGDGRPGPLRWVIPVYIAAVLLMGVAAWGVSGIAGGIIASLVALVLMVTATGMPGWREPLQDYGDAWREGDMQRAWNEISHLLAADQRSAALSPDVLHMEVATALIHTTFERYFLSIFWYALLGPAGLVLILGALAVRNHYPSAPVRERFRRWVDWLAWAPAWLLSFSFAIAGDLSGWLNEHKSENRPSGESPRGWLVRTASGALSSYALDPRRFEQHHPEAWPDFGNRSLLAVRNLLNRSMFVWLGALAVLAIMGWLP